MLTVESHLESGSVQYEIDDAVDMCFVLYEGEDILAFASIDLLALTSTQVIEIGSFSLVVAKETLLVLLSLSLCVSQGFEVFGDIFFDPWGLEVDQAEFQQED